MIAVVLHNPKFTHNVGAALRACAAFGADTLCWTGSRCNLEGGERLPREERMKGYKHVETLQNERPFDLFPELTPVAVEVREASESLTTFQHPENAMYVFGPEDGSLPQSYLCHCHRFVHIPSHFCLNLSAAVNVVLYDRRLKRQLSGEELSLPLSQMLKEIRGPVPAGWDGR